MSDPTACEWCARQLPAPALERVELVAIRDPADRRVFRFCRNCAHKPDATWKLRWREVER